jgi:hypothetical protein
MQLYHTDTDRPASISYGHRVKKLTSLLTSALESGPIAPVLIGTVIDYATPTALDHVQSVLNTRRVDLSARDGYRGYGVIAWLRSNLNGCTMYIRNNRMADRVDNDPQEWSCSLKELLECDVAKMANVFYYNGIIYDWAFAHQLACAIFDEYATLADHLPA